MGLGPFEFVLVALAVFRLTHLLVYDSITEGIRKLFITYVEETAENGQTETIIVLKKNGWKRWVGELFSCHWCMGIWMSIFLWCGYSFYPMIFSIVIVILAAAAVAAVIETILIQWME